LKILILSDINSAHTQKWALALAHKGLDVAVFSLSYPVQDWYSQSSIVLLNESTINKNKFSGNLVSKLSYLKLVPQLKKAITEFKPNVVHAHYASSYGLLGALSGFHPYVISAWGSDVMDFPNRNFINKNILKYNFRKADQLLATSEILVKTILKYTRKNIFKIPFGIDTNYFEPTEVERNFVAGTIVIGSIKSLEQIYGTDILIKAFKKVCDSDVNNMARLLIVGGGSKEKEYKNLVSDLNIIDKVIFTGKVEYAQVVKYHNMIDIFVNVSRNESFGVSVLEASACEKPVIVSNVGGLAEVVENNNTGLLVQSENIEAIANAIKKLFTNKDLCLQMGLKGRMFVQAHYQFSNNVESTIEIYKQLLKK
jgi:glycosyltransferase involved in cell wall biosynthesis